MIITVGIGNAFTPGKAKVIAMPGAVCQVYVVVILRPDSIRSLWFEQSIFF